jgi:hypothetical protein
VRYRTRSGYDVQIGRVQRRYIDEAVVRFERPQPPRASTGDLGIEVFGGIEEDVYLYDDPGYRRALYAYYVALASHEFSILSRAIEVEGVPDDAIEELARLGLIRGDDEHAALLRYEVLRDNEDWERAVEAVIYNSTVTERGIAEAAERFNAHWREEPLTSVSVPGAPAYYSPEYEARLAARHGLLSWPEFCNLDGPEQSSQVAFYRHSMMLQWLSSNR